MIKRFGKSEVGGNIDRGITQTESLKTSAMREKNKKKPNRTNNQNIHRKTRRSNLRQESIPTPPIPALANHTTDIFFY